MKLDNLYHFPVIMCTINKILAYMISVNPSILQRKNRPDEWAKSTESGTIELVKWVLGLQGEAKMIGKFMWKNFEKYYQIGVFEI